MTPKEIDRIVAAALDEDMPDGDLTTRLLVPARAEGRAVLRAHQFGVFAGLAVFERIFRLRDPKAVIRPKIRDGQSFRKGAILAVVRGRGRALLEAERTALNFVQRLSGIATLTRAYVEAVAGTGAVILDTRKTTPGLRLLEKSAVVAGGGRNHRMSLSDMILIKDNHITLAGGVAEAYRRARRGAGGHPIEIEVASFAEAREAVEAGADWVMLDNLPPAEMRRIVLWIGGRARIEASGKVSLRNVRAIAGTGVDFISVGKITHSAPAVDLSLDIEVAGASRR